MAKEVISALPYNLEAEQSLLGAILIDAEMQYEIRSRLNVDDFYFESHKLVFEGICSVLDSNIPVDVVTLTDEMGKTQFNPQARARATLANLASEMEGKTTLEKAGGIEYLSDIARSVPSSANYEYYLNIVKRDSTLRKLIRSADSIVKEARFSTDEKKSLSFAEKSIYDISEKLDTSSLTNLADNVPDVLADLKSIQSDKNFMQGLYTGFTLFDKMTNGLHKGNLIIVAARPSVGKTTFVMNIVEHVALKKDAVCAVFALEMTKRELAERMAYSISGVSSEIAKSGKLSKSDWNNLWNAEKLIKEHEIYIDDTSMTTVPEILSKCRRLKNLKGKLDLIVVDHIQLMNSERQRDSKQSEITDISRGLKMIAKELDVPVIALSQLNRAVETNRRKPILSDLRESGAIEQDADIVMFIHRPEMAPDPKDNKAIQQQQEGQNNQVSQFKKDEAEIIIAKNRSGPRGNFNLIFKGEISKFVNIASAESEKLYNSQPNKNFSYNSTPAELTEVEEIPIDDMSDALYDE